jgi:hypothetical protein
MDLMIRKRKLMCITLLVYALVFISCKNVNKSGSLPKEWFIAQENSMSVAEDMTLNDLMNELCLKGCSSDIGYTGDYALKYDCIGKSFKNEGFIIDLPFVGYKCRNSLIDMFFTPILIEYCNKDSVILSGKLVLNDSIESFVQRQYEEIIFYGDPQPLVSIQLQSNQSINCLTDILYFVVSGYFKNQRQEVLKKLNVDIFKDDLEKDKIKIFTEKAPLKIRLEPKDKDLYCD